MDTRVILNLPKAQDLSLIPELDGTQELKPRLTALSPVRRLDSVSLILPTFFNSELKASALRQVLSGLSNSSAVAEIVLVQSDGEKRDLEPLRSLLGNLPLLLADAPPNHRARSRNIGAEIAQGPYLLFLDDDMAPKNWRLIDVILSTLIEGSQDCALFPRRHYARFPLLYDRFCLEEVIQQWRSGTGVANPFLFDPLRDGTTDLPMVFCFPGCFALIRKAAYRQLNGFDERFVGWGFEDTEFALKAIRQLRVLNLFRASEPFLHIDHPVSPYKSEEHSANYRKFYRNPEAIDIHRFCRTVFTGEDFDGNRPLLGNTVYSNTLRALQEQGIPIGLGDSSLWIEGVAKRLIERFSSPVPEFVVLHGSRAAGEAGAQSDYDVLLLYRGPVQDFFVSRSQPRIEIECASVPAFAALSEEPWLYDLRGVLDLAKIAQARLLSGHASQWEHWRSQLIETAAKNGLCFWLLLGLGLRLHASKHGTLVERYLRALHQITTTANLPFALDPAGASSVAWLTPYARDALEQQFPQWQDLAKRGEKFFPLQIPEIWAALHFLAGGSAAPEPADARR